MSPGDRRSSAAPGLSLAELSVLGIVAEDRPHGFAVARVLASDGEIGRIYAVARPAVYRAIERLIEAGLIEELDVEPGHRGPQRTPLKITRRGQRTLQGWLQRPVAHVREIRTEFLVKVALIERGGLEPLPLISAQLEALTPVVAGIAEQHRETHGVGRAVSLWRLTSAQAALDFLEALASDRLEAGLTTDRK